MVVLPMLRPLRLLRLVTLLAIVHRSSGQSLRGRVVIYATGATALLIGVAALAMLDAERHAQGAAITSYGTALWWAMETVTTVGYGDMAPVTTTGRMIAGALMIGGTALLGIVTAKLASWLVERVAEQDEASQAATRKQVADLSEEVRAWLPALTGLISRLSIPIRCVVNWRRGESWRSTRLRTTDMHRSEQ